MKTSVIPLNEFTENDRLILGAFPYLFLLGIGVAGDHSLTHEFYSHMNQFAGSMARESQFYFSYRINVVDMNQRALSAYE
jgi:hypothetical protein